MPSKTFSVNFETNGARKARRQMDKMGDESASAGSSLKKAGKVGAAAIGAITTAVTGAVAGISKLAKDTAEYADSIDKAAERTGIGREELQRLKFAAEQSGASLEAVESTASSFARRIARIEEGTGQASDAFKQLGVSLRDSSGELRDQGATYNDVLGSLAEMDNATRRASIGSQLFGRQFSKLQPLLNQGADGMNELREQADELGVVMGGSTVKSFTALKDQFNSFMAQLRRTGQLIATAFLPVIRDQIIPAMRSANQAVQGWIQSFQNAGQIEGAMGTALSAIRELWRGTRQVLSVMKGAWTQFTSDLRALWDTWGTQIIDGAQFYFGRLRTLFGGLLAVIEGIWDTLIGGLTGNWSRMWEGIKQTFTSFARTIASLMLGWVETMLSTLSSIAEYVPGVGESIASGLDSATESVRGFKKQIRQANEEAIGLQNTWQGFGEGSFGGGGAGTDFSGGGGGAGGSFSSGGQGQSGAAGNEDSGLDFQNVVSGGSSPQLADVFSGLGLGSIRQAIETGLIQSVQGANNVLETLQQQFKSATSSEQRQRIQGLIEKVKQMRAGFQRTQRQLTTTETLAMRFSQNLGQGIGRTIGQLVTFQDQISSVGDAFQSIGQTIQQALSQVISKLVSTVAKAAALKAAISLIPGFGSVGGASSFIGILTGLLPGAAEGGFVMNSGIARIHKGEAIVNEKMMQNMGPMAGAITVQVEGKTRTEGRELVTTYDKTKAVQNRLR